MVVLCHTPALGGPVTPTCRLVRPATVRPPIAVVYVGAPEPVSLEPNGLSGSPASPSTSIARAVRPSAFSCPQALQNMARLGVASVGGVGT